MGWTCPKAGESVVVQSSGRGSSPRDRVGSKGGGWRKSLLGRRINSKGDDHPEGIGLAPGQGVSPWGEG